MRATDNETPTAPPGLVYVSDEAPGIRRLKQGKGFIYRRADGQQLIDKTQLDRIRRLAIPPAYTNVWICPSPQGHLQATGRDARGRKQYRYHPQWRLARDETKFEHMLDFAAALPHIRARVKRDLAASSDSPVVRDTVIAAIVRLLDTTLVRVGNEEYARSNGSYGLTTMRKRHADIRGSALRLRFRGKSGITHEVELQDKRIARIIKRCQALPGQELFQYLDDAGETHSIGSAEVNDYLRTASGRDVTAKDFRTWHGSVYAYTLCLKCATDESLIRNATWANKLLGEVAKNLGNTVAVCRKSYVHPRVLALLTDSSASLSLPVKSARKQGLSRAECAFFALLKAAN